MFARLERIRTVMKQYTNESQTAKLIELGFEKPKSIWALSCNCPSDKQLSYESSLGLTIIVEERFTPEYAYSIGELIEMLPKEIEHPVWFGKKKIEEIGWWKLRIDSMGKEYPWAVVYHREDSAPLAMEYATELIDALYDMVVKLKEEGVI